MEPRDARRASADEVVERMTAGGLERRDSGRVVSQANVDVARRALEAFNRRDRAAWLALQDPESEHIPSRDWPESDAIRGSEAAWDFYAEVIGAWREAAFEAVETFEAGDDKLVQHVRAEMQGKASGASVVLSYWLATTLHNGKILRVEWFADRDGALEAVGLRDG